MSVFRLQPLPPPTVQRGRGLVLGGWLLAAAVSGAAQAQMLVEPPALRQPRLASAEPGASELVPAADPLTGPRSRLQRDWIGRRRVDASTAILVMAGHADSQNIGGSGTAGEAVGRLGGAAMYPGISDELYWNMVIATSAVALGQQRGLDIRYYRPPFRTIVDGNEAGTNWSVGHDHAANGGYALEIHFDAYGSDGVGSGLIPPVHRPFSRIDESLAQEFGGYPMAFRDVLGGPKRGIGLLEIGKLEGRLEASLRDPLTRQQSVQAIAERIVRALEAGLGRLQGEPGAGDAPMNTSGNGTVNGAVNSGVNSGVGGGVGGAAANRTAR
ncbi:MAG: dehydrogenase [Synechococcaceae cyanobacterium ELA182]